MNIHWVDHMAFRIHESFINLFYRCLAERVYVRVLWPSAISAYRVYGACYGGLIRVLLSINTIKSLNTLNSSLFQISFDVLRMITDCPNYTIILYDLFL